MKRRIAIVGSNGIPSKYGGFETLVEYLAEHLSDQFSITVFCSSKFQDYRVSSYKGVDLQYINLDPNGWQSVFYDFFSLLRCIKNYDKVLLLGCSGGILQWAFYRYRHKIIINIGGLDWQRSKWNLFTRKFLKLSEKFALRFSNRIISDNQGIKEYIREEYGFDSTVVAYGGDQAFSVDTKTDLEEYPFLKSPYAFALARIQPDNNIEMLCNSFDDDSLFPLVIVGNWNSSRYGQELRKIYKKNSKIILLDAIYDQNELNLVRSNCYVYLHGHSAGGTNPALVEAMNLGLPIFAFDNIYNRYTTENQASFFSNSKILKEMLANISENELQRNSENMHSIAKSRYCWSHICAAYARIFNDQ